MYNKRVETASRKGPDMQKNEAAAAGEREALYREATADANLFNLRQLEGNPIYLINPWLL